MKKAIISSEQEVREFAYWTLRLGHIYVTLT